MILFKTENGKISTFPDRFCTELPYVSIPFEESFDIPLVEWLFYQNINKPVFTSEMETKYDWELSSLSDGRDIFYTKVGGIDSIFIFVPYLQGLGFRVRQELKQLFPEGIKNQDQNLGYIDKPTINVHKMVVTYLMTTYDLSKEKAESFLPKSSL